MVFWTDKIHARHGFRWVHPVHEVHEYERPDYETVLAEGVQLDHRADPTKSRAQYLPLLELSVQEAPMDDRNMHYLGGNTCSTAAGRSASKRCSGTSPCPRPPGRTSAAPPCGSLPARMKRWGNVREAERWLLRAVGEAPHLRETMGGNGGAVLPSARLGSTAFFALRALKIAERPKTYICEASAWGSPALRPCFAGAVYETGRVREAIPLLEKALEIAPGDERLQENLRLMRAETRRG